MHGEIQGLLEEKELTPAQVAEEIMKDENADSALEGLVDLFKRKKMKGDECDHAKADDKKWQILLEILLKYMQTCSDIGTFA
ncbi:hypothetical protein TorRG33x02_047590 [Trema orientale]|uniref:AAA+ ATPase At3g28540-like C-terminal domain-containing protein n=1 Tax=Trema orientale TaxID=63057 RepID=A0A2P5FP60_TREOI|nr:hypothetical protein TorRG33x02_047590 [Trema orientale]